MDTSFHIKAIIDRCTYKDSDEVIGEFQFCYVTGMLLGNLACMEHWGYVIRVLFKAYSLAVEQPVFFRKIIEALHTQLIYDDKAVEGSIFDQDAELQDDLKIILTVFKSRLTEQLLAKGVDISDDQSKVGKAFESLESWLWKWGWDLRGNYVRSGQIQLEDGEFVDAELKEFEAEDERGEYAPVVVDIDEDGRENGLVRFT
jgi:A1 cistron-splicing factor AAR2